jgi:hypothetical protein
MEIRRITEKHARHRDGRRRCTERRDRDTELEPTHKLLQHENRARHWCVERGGKPGTHTGRKQHPALWPLAAEDFSDKVGNARPHLHARPLATERKPGADCEHAAEEFHANEVKRRLRDLLVQHGLDMWDEVTVAAHHDLDRGPVATDATDDVTQDLLDFLARWPLAGAQQRQHGPAGRRLEIGWKQ